MAVYSTSIIFGPKKFVCLTISKLFIWCCSHPSAVHQIGKGAPAAMNQARSPLWYRLRTFPLSSFLQCISNVHKKQDFRVDFFIVMARFASRFFRHRSSLHGHNFRTASQATEKISSNQTPYVWPARAHVKHIIAAYNAAQWIEWPQTRGLISQLLMLSIYVIYKTNMLACISGVRLLLEVVDFLATAHYFIDLLIAVFALYCTKPLVGFTFQPAHVQRERQCSRLTW